MNFESFISSLDRRLEPSVQIHLKHVYSTLTISVLSAALGGYVHLYTNLAMTIGRFMNFILMTGFLIALYCTPDNGKNQLRRLSYLLGFSFFSGFGLGPLIEFTLYLNPSIIPKAFLFTGIIFGCFTMSSIFGNRRKTLYLGGFLFSALSLLSIIAIFNLFLNTYFMHQAYIVLALGIMCGFVVYDTALIIEKRLRGDTDYISHSILLFMDMISIFRYVLIILAEKDRNQKKKNGK